MEESQVVSPETRLAEAVQLYRSIALDDLWTMLSHVNGKIEHTVNFPSGRLSRSRFTIEDFICRMNKEFRALGIHAMMPTQDSDKTQRSLGKTQLCIVRDQLREIINIRVRPSLPKRNILEFPIEVLLEIFGNLGAPPEEDFRAVECYRQQDEYKNIQNVRLTCRRFHDTSSHLLLCGYVRVVLNQASLKRLEEISEHPIIGKRITSVRIDMDYYGSRLAQRRNCFRRYCELKLRTMERQRDRQATLPTFNTLISAQFTAEKVYDIISALSVLELDHPSYHYDKLTSYEVRILRTHEEYRSQYADYCAAYRKAPQVISKAMARMPFSQNLIFEENRHIFQERLELERVTSKGKHDLFEIFFRAILTPILSWEDGLLGNVGKPPADLLINLPIAVHQVGIKLTGLQIHVFPLMDPSLLAMSPTMCQGLEKATKNLRSFVFSDARSQEKKALPPPDEEDMEHHESCIEFVSGLLTSKSLAYIELDLQFLSPTYRWPLGAEEPPDVANVGRLMANHEWPKLQFLRFCGAFMNQDLRQLVDRAEGKPFTLEIAGHLSEGTWAETLDILRNSVSGHSRIGLLRYFCRLTGAEATHMSGEAMFEIFGCFDPVGWASQYIRGEREQNPVRELIDVDVDSSSSSDDDIETSSSNFQDSVMAESPSPSPDGEDVASNPGSEDPNTSEDGSSGDLYEEGSSSEDSDSDH